jgi:hypothetical protein
MQPRPMTLPEDQKPSQDYEENKGPMQDHHKIGQETIRHLSTLRFTHKGGRQPGRNIFRF